MVWMFTQLFTGFQQFVARISELERIQLQSIVVCLKFNNLQIILISIEINKILSKEASYADFYGKTELITIFETLLFVILCWIMGVSFWAIPGICVMLHQESNFLFEFLVSLLIDDLCLVYESGREGRCLSNWIKYFMLIKL